MKKVMLVTGASRGIGASVALMAGLRSYRVVVNYVKDQVSANKVVQAIETAGGEAIAIQADVGEFIAVEKMFRAIDQRWGRLDVLVNNAGMLANFRVEDVTDENVSQIFRTNVFSTYFCSREAIRRMSTKHGGSGGVIVNLSSVAARLGGLGGGSGYAATKAAISTFTLALAKEVGHEGIRVNAVSPGLIETEIHNVHGGISQMQELAKTAVPMGRHGSAEEVAEAILWLASDASSYVDGVVLDVSGGR
jgi:NAD(P)-dependent dehydrogenase (short-subunit alcohol dehydrogenase family)